MHISAIIIINKYFAKDFKIKDLGWLSYLIGVEDAKSTQGISLSRQKYILDLLKETTQTNQDA